MSRSDPMCFDHERKSKKFLASQCPVCGAITDDTILNPQRTLTKLLSEACEGLIMCDIEPRLESEFKSWLKKQGSTMCCDCTIPAGVIGTEMRLAVYSFLYDWLTGKVRR